MSRDVDASRTWARKDDRAPMPPIARFSRANRVNPTPAERKLWTYLRRLDVAGSHFRRQVVIGPFIADFACRSAKLVVEVDGGQHCDSARDVERTAALEVLGWRVVRFWNADVTTNIDGVMAVVGAEIDVARGGSSGTTPTPNPSPQGGGEQVGAP